MTSISILSVAILVTAILVFLAGVPPFDSMLYHYWTMYHPVARKMKAVRVGNSIMIGKAANSAMELGLFDLLHEKPNLSASEIAQALALPLRGVDPLLQVLTTSDFLYDNQGRYTNSKTVEHHWISGLPVSQDLRSMVRIVGSKDVAQADMTASIQQGGTVKEFHAETDSLSFWELFATYSGSMATKTAEEMVHQLAHLFKSDHGQEVAVLDIASGSGSYGFAVLGKFSHARVIQSDYANVLAVTSQNALDRNVDVARIGQVPGNFFDVELPENHFHVALATNIIHHFSPTRTTSFFQKVYTHLRPGGHVVVVDFCRPTGPYSLWEGMSPMPRTFSMTMLLWSKEGKAYSAEEIIQHLTDAGFKDAKVAGHARPNYCFVTGQKPLQH